MTDQEICEKMARAYLNSERINSDVWGSVHSAMVDVLKVVREAEPTTKGLTYECHITLKSDKKIKLVIEAMGWKFSMIEGDPILGNETFCYATKHFDPRLSLNEVVDRMAGMANALIDMSIPVVRQKVELIMWDKRS